MSYSINTGTGPVAVDDLEKVLTDALETYKKNLAASDYELSDAADEQARTGIAAAVAVAKSGHVSTGHVSAVISGHANPDHKPTPGWANDALTVGVTQMAAPTPAPQPAV